MDLRPTLAKGRTEGAEVEREDKLLLMRYSVFSLLIEPARTSPGAASWFLRGTVYLWDTGVLEAAEGTCLSAFLAVTGWAEASAGEASWTNDLERFFVRLSLRTGCPRVGGDCDPAEERGSSGSGGVMR